MTLREELINEAQIAKKEYPEKLKATLIQMLHKAAKEGKYQLELYSYGNGITDYFSSRDEEKKFLKNFCKENGLDFGYNDRSCWVISFKSNESKK